MLSHTGAPATSRHSLTQILGAPRPALPQTTVGAPSAHLIYALNETLSTLPSINRDLLLALIDHLGYCANQAFRTLMTLDNLRLILSPTLKMSPRPCYKS